MFAVMLFGVGDMW